MARAESCVPFQGFGSIRSTQPTVLYKNTIKTELHHKLFYNFGSN